MADYAYDDESQELQKLNQEVLDEPDVFENWEKLVRAAESLEGGLNRNSSPQSIAAARGVYDRFLAKFPLFFGYWKKYADLEFSIAGTESAEYIYERGVASVPVSVDLWVNYCGFKVETCHDSDLIRELFERAAENVGLDFLSHPFWDKYLEFEERLEAHDRIFAILLRLLQIPTHQYARYFERLRGMASSRPLNELASGDVLQQISADGLRMAGNQANVEQDVRAKLDAYYLDAFHRTQADTNKRWPFEQEIKRPYFHVTELGEAELANWHKYLDFEEAEGDYRRITFLYERCVIVAAHYDEFWLRYARYMYVQDKKTEEIRSIFTRAACFYTPIARPEIRLQWALFEESSGRPSVAAEIYNAILAVLPDHLQTIIRLANLAVRQSGTDSAIQIYNQYITHGEVSVESRGSLVGELAKLIHHTDSADAARKTFAQHQAVCQTSYPFWAAWLNFEITSPDTKPSGSASKHLSRAKAVYHSIRDESKLAPEQIKELSVAYMNFVVEKGDSSSVGEYLELDALVNGSAVVGSLARMRWTQGDQGKGWSGAATNGGAH